MQNLKMYIFIAVLLFISSIMTFVSGDSYVDTSMAVTLAFMGGVFIHLYRAKRKEEEDDQ